MLHLITNKMIKFLLFISFFMLISCTSPEIRPPEQPEFTSTIKSSSAISSTTTKTPAVTASTSLWLRLFSLYQFPQIQNERIQAEIAWYSKHPAHLNRIQKNAAPYLYHIVNEIEQRGIPGELALLPAIESAYRPFAYSHGRAAGLWQFIPSTGRAFGLQETWWYDGRRDVYTSTSAALRYLTQLSNRFENNWFLALAGYNAGGGTISLAIRKNKQQGLDTDYWSLKLRKETLRYVPKLIAVATILINSDAYNIKLVDIPNTPFFERVDIKKQIDLTRAAELANISIEELYALNPAFNQWATDPEGPHYLLIPSDKVAKFKQRLAILPDSQRLKWVRHKVKKGETIGLIARRYHTTIAQIAQANNINNNLIRQGKHLLIPTPSQRNNSSTIQKSAAAKEPYKIEYRVQAGDSFWLIARRYHIGIKQLTKWNAMSPSSTLKIGQKLIIWSKDSHPNTPTLLTSGHKHQTIYYTVRNGDSLYLIAKKFNTSIKKLKQLNSLKKKYLKPGQTLKVIVDITRS